MTEFIFFKCSAISVINVLLSEKVLKGIYSRKALASDIAVGVKTEIKSLMKSHTRQTRQLCNMSELFAAQGLRRP